MNKPPENKQYWGIWSTSGFIILIFLVASIGNIILLVCSIVICSYPLSELNISNFINYLITDGLIFSLSIWVNAVISLLMVYLFVKLRKGKKLTEYIGFNKCSIRSIVLPILILSAFYLFANYVTIRYNISVNEGFMLSLFKSNVPYILLFSSLVIIAPFYEEVVFRGFFLQGIVNSKLGKYGAIIITSVIWTLIHTQYNYFTQGYLFIIGIFLCYIRIKSKSIWPSIISHMFINLTATIMTTLYIYQ